VVIELFYRLIKEARRRKKLTQEQLAEQLGVQRAVVSKYETGRITPSVKQAQKIAAVLDIPLLDLIGIEPENNNELERTKLETLIEKFISQNENFDSNKLSDAYYYDENGFRFKGDGSPLEKLIHVFDKLNPEGQEKAVERVEELTEIPKYQRNKE
jgi:transcriptional regulator with XRE-family HTH domain